MKKENKINYALLTLFILGILTFFGFLFITVSNGMRNHEKEQDKVNQCYIQTATEYCESINMSFYDMAPTFNTFSCYPILDKHNRYDYHIKKEFQYTKEEVNYCESLN